MDSASSRIRKRKYPDERDERKNQLLLPVLQGAKVIVFKDQERHSKEIFQITPKTLLILADANYWCHQRGKMLIITCIGRTLDERMALVKAGLALNKVSVHEVWRGFDMRPLFPDELNQQLLDYINMKYPYDPGRPDMRTVIRHEGTRDHLHFQSVT